MQPAVQVVTRVVHRQLNPTPLQVESAAVDAAGVRPDHASQVVLVFEIVLHPIMTKHHVHQLAVTIRHLQGKQGAAQGADSRPATAAVQQFHLGYGIRTRCDVLLNCSRHGLSFLAYW